jgi:hypothetical protein
MPRGMRFAEFGDGVTSEGPRLIEAPLLALAAMQWDRNHEHLSRSFEDKLRDCGGEHRAERMARGLDTIVF